jgi:hypothetical protein
MDTSLLSPRGRFGAPPAYMSKARKALQKVRLGTGRMTILVIGTSISAGQGAGTGGTPITGARPFAYPSRLATKLASLGIPSQSESFFGNAAQAGAYGTYDPRVSGAWSYDGARTTAGGNLFGSVSSQTLSFLASTNVDTHEIGYITAPGKDTITVNIDGGAPTTGPSSINSNASLALVKATVKPASAGSHTLNLVAGVVSGGFLLMGVKAYNSTIPGVDIVNCGWPGSTSANWNDSANVWSPLNAIAYHAPDLTIIEGWPNDYNNAVALATTLANAQAVITAAAATGNVIVVSSPQSNPATKASAAIQTAFRQAHASLIDQNSGIYVDWPYRIGDFTAANGAGYMFDDIHANQTCYGDFGDYLGACLAAL